MTAKDKSFVNGMIGFLDGVSARNLASIEQGTALQVSEITVRLRTIKRIFESSEEESVLASEIQLLEDQLKNHSLPLVTRLIIFGSGLHNFLILHRNPVKDSSDLRFNIDQIILRFIEAAKIIKDDKLLDLALALGGQILQVR